MILAVTANAYGLPLEPKDMRKPPATECPPLHRVCAVQAQAMAQG